jgi:hypothetical protein
VRYSKTFGVLALAALVAAITMRSHANDGAIEPTVGPPPTAVETGAAPREGYTWPQDCWDSDNGNHTWGWGHWERDHEHCERRVA